MVLIDPLPMNRSRSTGTLSQVSATWHAALSASRLKAILRANFSERTGIRVRPFEQSKETLPAAAIRTQRAVA
jgi:hypothetical protein